MRILVVGDGKVGHTVAEQLTREGHDVVIIDKNEDVLQRCEDTLDVLCIRGNGANARTLLDAGVEKADFVVAATASDETNMLCCLIAKRLGARYTIARIRDPEYNESLSLLQRETSIDNAINPERATALEISRLLRFPFANNIETFAKGRSKWWNSAYRRMTWLSAAHCTRCHRGCREFPACCTRLSNAPARSSSPTAISSSTRATGCTLRAIW